MLIPTASSPSSATRSLSGQSPSMSLAFHLRLRVRTVASFSATVFGLFRLSCPGLSMSPVALGRLRPSDYQKHSRSVTQGSASSMTLLSISPEVNFEQTTGEQSEHHFLSIPRLMNNNVGSKPFLVMCQAVDQRHRLCFVKLLTSNISPYRGLMLTLKGG